MIELLPVLAAAVVALVLIMAVSRQTSNIDRNYYRQKWQAIETASASPHAVADADKLLDLALKQKHFRGATMGDRLRSAGPSLKNKNSVWEAHKFRNRLVHEADFQPKPSETKKALSALRAALKDLGAL